MGMPCSRTSPHTQHVWQMSMTGWCLCLGQETTPIFDSLIELRTLRAYLDTVDLDGRWDEPEF